MSGQEAPLLELKGVFKHFGAVTALAGVDFHVSSGEVMALVGDNGAGKSTMIKTIAGIHPLDEGQHQGHGHQGRLLEGLADLHRAVRRRLQGAGHFVAETARRGARDGRQHPPS